MTNPREDAPVSNIDHLLHDAEKAEGGADFAEMMMGQEPNNPAHRAARDNLRNKAAALVAEAHAADPLHTHWAWDETDLRSLPDPTGKP